MVSCAASFGCLRCASVFLVAFRQKPLEDFLRQLLESAPEPQPCLTGGEALKLANIVPPPFEKPEVEHFADSGLKVLADFLRENPKLHFLSPVRLVSRGNNFESLSQAAVVNPAVTAPDRLDQIRSGCVISPTMDRTSPGCNLR